MYEIKRYVSWQKALGNKKIKLKLKTGQFFFLKKPSVKVIKKL